MEPTVCCLKESGGNGRSCCQLGQVVLRTTCNHRIIKLAKSTKITQANHQPMPMIALDPIPQCDICPLLEHLHGWRLHLPLGSLCQCLTRDVGQEKAALVGPHTQKEGDQDMVSMGHASCLLLVTQALHPPSLLQAPSELPISTARLNAIKQTQTTQHTSLPKKPASNQPAL